MTIHLTSHRIALVAVGGLLAVLSFGGVAQAATENAFRYSSPKSSSLMLSAADFVPSSTFSSENYRFEETGIKTTSISQRCFVAPVHLPQGATIKQLKAFYRRPNAADVVFVHLRRVNTTGPAVSGDPVANEVPTVAPVTPGGSFTYAANASRNIVNNVQFAYRVELCIANTGSLIHARVDYTFTNAGD
jgi:hypothetical protein